MDSMIADDLGGVTALQQNRTARAGSAEAYHQAVISVLYVRADGEGDRSTASSASPPCLVVSDPRSGPWGRNQHHCYASQLDK